jgi:AcrR family transcriptional regulator
MVRQADRRAETIGAILAAARKLFGSNGFETTSIDDIAAKAGVAKGAVYHHFKSKEEIFTRVLDGVQQELAEAQVPQAVRKLRDPLDQIAGGVLHYLIAATQPGIGQILLVDGPVVIGWAKWREIDDRYFGQGARAAVALLLGPKSTQQEIETCAHLLLGAVMEAALVCAKAADPKRTARQYSDGIRTMLQGFRR